MTKPRTNHPRLFCCLPLYPPKHHAGVQGACMPPVVPCALYPVPCAPCTLCPVPCYLYPVPYALLPVPCALLPVPCALFCMPCHLPPMPCHGDSCPLCPVPCALPPVTGRPPLLRLPDPPRSSLFSSTCAHTHAHADMHMPDGRACCSTPRARGPCWPPQHWTRPTRAAGGC